MITSSQKLKKQFHLGDMITVKVIEKLDEKSWIVSLEGTLIQVKNPQGVKLTEGMMVRMQVTSLNPPQLKI